MHRRPITLVITVLAGLAAALPAAAESPTGPQLRAHAPRAVDPAVLVSLAGAKGFEAGVSRSRSAKACEIMTMTCNSTVDSALTADDCLLDDNTWIDFWEFQGAVGQMVTVDMTSTDFDTFLFLIDPTPATVAFNDDVSPTDTNSRIVHTLGSSGTWTIGANAFFEGDLGDYRLSLQCSASGPSVPAAPSSLTADPLSDTEAELAWRDNSSNEDEFRVELRAPGESFIDIGFVAANSTATDVINLQPATTYDFRVRARNAQGDSPYSNVATATTFPEAGACIPSDTNLCLSNSRFRLEVEWRDFNDNVGPARVVPLGSFAADDSGLFYFFAPDNWEMLVKVLDTCGSPFNTFWVFAAATTNVEYTLRVTDTETGAVQEYENPLGTAADAITDTSAFPCP